MTCQVRSARSRRTGGTAMSSHVMAERLSLASMKSSTGCGETVGSG